VQLAVIVNVVKGAHRKNPEPTNFSNTAPRNADAIEFDPLR